MKDSPCKNCPERFTACSGSCPKDKRGEYGNQNGEDRKAKISSGMPVMDSFRRTGGFKWKLHR